eukprot:GEMP01043762.1.p1 GENE.GEMP01043762.1~~GEMP01043762.1.p1  ORF type:complete len:466 (+),score=96.60 GEMP01043762.1:44-1441(+)
MVHSQESGLHGDLWDCVYTKIDGLADSFMMFRRLIDCGFDPELIAEGLTEEQKAIVTRKMNMASYVTELEAEVAGLQKKCEKLTEVADAATDMAEKRRLESVEWQEAFETEQRHRKELEVALDITEKRAQHYEEEYLASQEIVRKLIAKNEVHIERLDVFLSHNTTAIRVGTALSAWQKQARVQILFDSLSEAQKKLVEERIRYTGIIDELRQELVIERAEIARLVQRLQWCANQRLMTAKSWMNPTDHARFLGLVFEAWRNARDDIKDSKSNWLNVMSLRWHIRQLAWVERLINKLDIDTVTAIADASATQFALELESLRHRETQESAHADSEEFRHMRDIAKEEFLARLSGAKEEMRSLLGEEVRILTEEKERLVSRVEDLEDTMYAVNENGTTHEDQFPVCRRSEGTRCIDCSKRIVLQQPELLIKKACRDDAITDFVQKMVGPFQASIFAKPAYAPRRRRR